jgi:hypothetical protein
LTPNLSPIDFERASENLRQERETFDQRKRHENRWFLLRLAMGYSSILLLASIMALSTYILLRAKEFPASVVASAGAALFVDVLGLLVSVWKIALNPDFTTKLAPVTQIGGGEQQTGASST